MKGTHQRTETPAKPKFVPENAAIGAFVVESAP